MTAIAFIFAAYLMPATTAPWLETAAYSILGACVMNIVVMNSPWFTLKEAAAYAKRGTRFLRNEVRGGRLKAAVVGGRKEIVTRAEWIDEWLMDQTKVTPLTIARRRTP